MSQLIKHIYPDNFTQKMETLLPENYCLNTYYQHPKNKNVFVMRNSQGYFHIITISKTIPFYGYTKNHYYINKNQIMVDTGKRYPYYKTIESARESM